MRRCVGSIRQSFRQVIACESRARQLRGVVRRHGALLWFIEQDRDQVSLIPSRTQIAFTGAAWFME